MAGWGLRRRALKLQIRAEKTERLLTKREQEAVRLYYAASFQQGISTELFGAVFTTLAFGVVLLIFQQYQDIQNRKAEIILQLGSPDNGFAVEAARQLRTMGWLEDGTLQDVRLGDANLQGAHLWGTNLQDVLLVGANLQGTYLWAANLRGTYLWAANLRGTYLWAANLRGTYLWAANLRDADLVAANLQNADLVEANLQGADLREADFRSADLWNANLQGANLAEPVFDEKTVLPDGRWNGEYDTNNNRIYTPESYYQPGVTDMTRYTNPNHPDFWQPDWVQAE